MNDNYSTARDNILMMTSLLNVTQAYRLVAQEENHKEISHQVYQNNNHAFVADRRRFLELLNISKIIQQFPKVLDSE